MMRERDSELRRVGQSVPTARASIPYGLSEIPAQNIPDYSLYRYVIDTCLYLTCWKPLREQVKTYESVRMDKHRRSVLYSASQTRRLRNHCTRRSNGVVCLAYAAGKAHISQRKGMA